MRIGRIRTSLVTAAAIVALAGCASGGQLSQASAPAASPPAATTQAAQPAPDPAPPAAASAPFTITVVGKCSDPHGFHLQATGMQPGDEYQTTATGPDGQPYTNLRNSGLGVVNANGQPSDWQWDCKLGAKRDANKRILPDPNGPYHVQVFNLTRGGHAEDDFDLDNSK